MLRGSSFIGGTCSRMPLIVPSAAMNSISRGMQVLCIQKLRIASSGHEKSIPAFSPSAVAYISPCRRSCGVRAKVASIRGRCGASTNSTSPCGRRAASGPGGQFSAGRAGGAGTALQGATQGLVLSAVAGAAAAFDTAGAAPSLVGAASSGTTGFSSAILTVRGSEGSSVLPHAARMQIPSAAPTSFHMAAGLARALVGEVGLVAGARAPLVSGFLQCGSSASAA